LLRQKSKINPFGRTSIRFKDALRRKVTIIDKNLNRVDQNQIKNIDRTDVDEAE
jgi:predicted translin family RNA/ssDNA-binding protein